METLVGAMLTGAYQVDRAANEKAANLISAVDENKILADEGNQDLLAKCLIIRATGLNNSINL